MNPIQVLKGWVTLDEAAGYISEKAGVQVAESDLLELAVEGKLRLSALFRRTGTEDAVIGTVVEREPGSCFIEFVEEDANPIRTTLNGLFELKVSDLPILCVNEAGEIESQTFGLEFETGVPGRVVRLPSKALPPSCRWVMRPSAVDNFLATLTGEEREIEAVRRLADLDRSAKEAAILRAEQAEAEAAELRRKLERERAAQQAAEGRAALAEAEASGVRQRLSAIESAPSFSELACDAILLGSENDDLKYSLERERQRREQAEERIKKLERPAGLIGWELGSAEFAALEERAKSAEQHADSLARQLAEKQAVQKLETPTGGVVFPYATKELEAMRAAVAKYWESYTPDKRQPTQVEVQLELCTLLGLERMKDGDMPRKAKELAGAIKPGTLPDA